nr:pilus assembly protein [Paenibacillus sp. JJ-100]
MNKPLDGGAMDKWIQVQDERMNVQVQHRMTRISRLDRLMSLRKQMLEAKKEQGSMVLEASLVLPVFLFFILFLIFIVQMTLISTALQSTAGETVKQLSTKVYPVSLVFAPSDSAGGEGSKEGLMWSELSLTEWADEYASSLPEPLSDWVQAAARSGEEPLQRIKTSALEVVLDPVIKPLLQPFVDTTLLDMERIHVNGVSVPNLRDKTNPYFRLELSYELPVKVPFLGKPLRIQVAAAERIWIGDTGEGSDGVSGEGKSGSAATVLSKPDPAFIGNQAKIKVQVEPGSTANLTIFYKSGESSAQHIGWAVADENGIIEWNWFVGTRTTEGTWSFVVETADGAQTETSFTVASRNKER